jgi:hypothetical protein
MNELFLYEIIRSILSYSTVIEGRFLVAEGYGNDLNANNYNDLIIDALENYKPIGRKYPVSVLMPPVEIVESYERGWTRFKLDQFFLCTTYYTGASELKGVNMNSNTANHPIQYDWKDMREVAGDFRRVFNTVIRNQGYMNYLYSTPDTKDYIRRVSNMGNDRLSGVLVSYELSLAMTCEITDYVNVNTITLPEIEDLHPLHKH